MSEIYKYLYTQIGIFGSLPTHKVFISHAGNKAKLVFADNSFIYGVVSDWALRTSGIDSRKPTWSEEPNHFRENEIRILNLYRASYPAFVTETGEE